MKKLCVLALLLAAAAAPGQQGPGPAILVLDLERVLTQCDEAKEALAKLKVTSEEKKKEFAEQQARLEDQMRQLQEKTGLSERDPKWYDALEDAMKKKGQLQAEAAKFNARISDAIARKMDQLMKGARESAEKIRKKRGATVVLLSKLGPIKFENEKQLEAEQIFRRVLCCDKDADITGDVLAAMNAWYKDNKKEDGTVKEREKEEATG